MALLRQVVSIDDSQFGFVPGRGTTDAIFVVRQLQEKYLAANKRLYMAFVDLEKAFDHVPRKVIWWALRKLGVDEWIVHLVQGMYSNARSRVHVGEGYSEEFEVKVGVHQGSVLSPLLFHHCPGSLQGCKIPLARSHWRVNIDGGRVKLAMRSPDRASVFSSSEFVIFQFFGRKNGKTPT